MVYVNNGILFSHKQEGNPAMGNNMDEVGGHYGRQNKADTERQIPCNSLIRTAQKSGGHKSRENSDRQGLGDGEGHCSKGTKGQRIVTARGWETGKGTAQRVPRVSDAERVHFINLRCSTAMVMNVNNIRLYA